MPDATQACRETASWVAVYADARKTPPKRARGVSRNPLPTRRAAEALDCDLAYVLIPRRPLDETVKRRARAIAEAHVAAASHSMQLEGQGISPRARAAQVTRLTEALVNGGSRLWEDL